MRIIFATGNAGKMREIREIMEGTGYEVLSMKEAGVAADPEENGKSFLENAMIKAKAVAQNAPEDIVLADDSGLVVDALNGEPGIYSARYMGRDTSYDIKNNAIIDRLEGVPDEKRTARFTAAIAAVFPDGTTREVEAHMEGKIGYKIAGANGFGFDPIFIPEGYDVTSAEISAEEKNSISHRGKALRAMKEEIDRYENSGAQ